MIQRRDKSVKVRRFQWISVSLLLAVGIVNILDRSTLAIANKNVSGDLHLTPTQMGLLLSAFSLSYAFAQLPVGALLDRIGARIVLGVGVFFWSLAQLAGGFVTSLRQFLAARVFLGLGEAPTYPAGAKIITDWFNKRERGGPIAIFLSSPTISPMIAPPIITLLMLCVGWRRMFVTMGVVGIALAIVWYVVARDRKHVALTAEEHEYFDESNDAAACARKLTLSEWIGLFTQPTMWGIVLGFIGIIYMIWVYLTWLPAYLENERHLSIARTGWVVSIPYVFATLGTLFCGYLADFLLGRGVSAINSRKWPICVGLLGGACFTIPVAYTPGTTTAVVYLCIVMFFLYMASSGAWALVTVATPNHMVASVGSLQNFGGYLVGTAAPVLTGWLVQRTHSFKSALVMSSIVAFAAALLYFFLISHPIREVAQPAPDEASI
jgi:sugar phosphate permease